MDKGRQAEGPKVNSQQDGQMTNGQNSDRPLGMSTYSLRRGTVQIFLAMILLHFLLVASAVTAALHDNQPLLALSIISFIVLFLTTAKGIYSGIRTVQGEIWIRRMGPGDLDFHIESKGKDEIDEVFQVLEALRQSSIRAIQLDLVQKLSDDLQSKNQELELTLDELHATQDQVISRQKLAELGELSAGVAHEIRNPLQFVKNFATASAETASLIRDELSKPDGPDQEEVNELLTDLTAGMERIEQHTDRANRIVSGMLAMSRSGQGAFKEADINQLLTQQTMLAYQAIRTQDMGFNVEIQQNLDPSAGELSVVAEDMARVFINLVSNACGAMAERSEQEGEGYQKNPESEDASNRGRTADPDTRQRDRHHPGGDG